ncbi:MAG: hypothetical protein AB7O88_26115 [Reyranellaceae bacterium]
MPSAPDHPGAVAIALNAGDRAGLIPAGWLTHSATVRGIGLDRLTQEDRRGAA